MKNRAGSRIEKELENRILVLDGAMGTAIQELHLGPEDFGGPSREGCNEYLNLTRPELIRNIHRKYLVSGADILETNSFGSTPLVLAEFGLEQQAYEISRRAALLAREVAEEFSTEDRPRFVAGSMGPTTRAISVTGGIRFQELIQNFAIQSAALLDGGVDYLLVETCQDTRNVKAALLGIQEAFQEKGRRIPVAVSVTIEPMGTMLAGQAVESLVVSLSHQPLLYLGLNCGTGPDLMSDHLRVLSEMSRTRVACVPNAGLPDEDGRYLESPRMMTNVLGRFVQEGWLNLIGGCCGTTPDHISALSQSVLYASPRVPPSYHKSFVSGIELLELDDSIRPALVGERTNVLGSRLFRRLIQEGKLDEATEIARRQVRNGAHIIDVCLQDPDRDEVSDVEQFMALLIHKVKVPLMIDSTDPRVMETALTFCQGKSILNSINLEDGEKRFAEIVPLIKKYGAAVVVGTIDEDRKQGMAVTRTRKLEIARRSHDLLVEKYGIEPEDIIFDPLVFPCATGDENYVGSALETVEGVRLIKESYPRTKTILGISNVSFGLPPAGREVVNSVFLYHCTRAGLDLAIVNTEKLQRYASIPSEERDLAEALLFGTNDETLTRFVEHFRNATSRIEEDRSSLPLDDRLANYIIEGSKDGLVADLELKLQESTPLQIINGPLMKGMDEVGRLFNNNELIVAEVLQSAEAMKAAVSYLEQFMDKEESGGKGCILLATVKGDVHDIGKNLVDIILSNNGYRVINLGIKIPPHDLIEAIAKHKPDIIGLSGLLVKSAQQMVVTAHEISQTGNCPPMMVGGAALTRSFTRLRIAREYEGTVVYANDAMAGLELAGKLLDPVRRRQLEEDLLAEEKHLRQRREQAQASTRTARTDLRVTPLDQLPIPPDWDRHVLKRIDLDELWPFVNPAMLYGKHMGLKGRLGKRFEEGDEKAQELQSLFEELKQDCRSGLMEASAVWQFFPATGDDDILRIFEPSGTQVLTEFQFPRSPRGLCLSDFVSPRHDSGPLDSICLFAVTAGSGIRQVYEEFKNRGEYLRSHAIQALALETAEGLAEWLHAKIRGLWGFPDPPATSMKDRFKARYRGKRYSFGYPACPDLADQKKLWQLIRPDEIGIQLTEEYMMEPEASVSALVIHHPEARYFGVADSEL